MKVKIKRSSNKKLRSALRGKVTVRTGFFGSDKGKSPIDNQEGIDMVGLAVTQNDGTDRAGRGNKVKIPARPFMDISAIHMRKESAKIVRDGVKEVLNGKKKLKQVGIDVAQKGASVMKGNIRDTSSPSNAPLTVAKKGFNDPLVHTGEMLKRVGSKVNNGKTIGIGETS